MDKKIKVKSYYDVKVETLLPATLHFRILAESPEQAAELIKHNQPNSVKYRFPGKRDIKLLVYDAGCSIIKFIKKFI
jgi:hypothetical protein